MREVGKFENGMSIAGGRPNLPHAPLTCGDKKGEMTATWGRGCPLPATDFIATSRAKQCTLIPQMMP
ncbi:unnamed protein product, partial [Iphiclides podalirius]